MSLELLAILVPLGIGFIVLIVKMSGLSKQEKICDEVQAREIYQTDYPDYGPGKTILTTDKHAAFLSEKSSHHIGLVEVVGDRFLTRHLTINDIDLVTKDNSDKLNVKFNDFTHPRGSYTFESHEDAKNVGNWITNLKDKL